MLPGGYILSLVSPDGEKGSKKDFKLQQMRGFFFREKHHASQPVVGSLYYSKITGMDFDRKNSEMQRCYELKLQYFVHLMRSVDSLEKTLMLEGIGGRRTKGMTEDEMAGWHH